MVGLLRNDRLRHHALALVAYGLIAVWLTWPQATVGSYAVAGGPIAQADGWQKVWNLWWAKRALLAGDNPLHTDLLFWPQGASLGFQPIDLSNALLTLPLLLAAGPLPAYTLAALLGFALTGYFTFLLALRVGAGWPASLVAGLLATAAPPHLERFVDGQVEHVALQGVALYLLALLAADERRTWRSGVFLALAATLVAYTNWYHALACALLTATFVAWRILANKRLPAVLPWLVALPLLALLAAPALLSFRTGLASSASSAEHWRTQAQFYTVDLVDLVLPSAHHPLWGPAVWAYQAPLHPNSAGWVTTPGYVLLGLALAGLLLATRRAGLWLALAATLIVFSLGPSLRVAGTDTGLPLPVAALVSLLPGLNFGHRRFIIATIAIIPLAIAAAWGLHTLAAGMAGTRARAGLLATLVALALFETAPPPMLLFPDDTPAVYGELRGLPGTLLSVPIDPGGAEAKSASLRAQLTHGRPIIGGYVARPPDYPLAEGAPAIGQLKALSCRSNEIVPQSRAIDLAALAYYDITQIVVHNQRLSAKQARCAHSLLERLGLAPFRDDGQVVAYQVPVSRPQPFVFVGDGWHYPEQEGRRIWRWMTEQGELFIVNTDSRPHTFAITLRAASLLRTRTVEFHLNDRLLLTTLATPEPRTYTLLATVGSGQHKLSLHAPVDRDPAAARDVSLAVEQVTLRQLN